MADGKRGAPKGNQNAAKAKLWTKTLKEALGKRGEERRGTLEDLANVLIDKAMEGEQWAMKEIGDRIEGKPAQAIIGGDDDDPAIKTQHTVIFVKPDAASDSE